MRKKVDKDKASPPTPLQGEGSDMFPNCILFAFYFQGILLPSPWRGVGGEALFPFSFLLFGVGGEALSLSTFFLIFNISWFHRTEIKTLFLRLCEAILWLWWLRFYLLAVQLHSPCTAFWRKLQCDLSQVTSLFAPNCMVIWCSLEAHLMQIAWIFNVNTGRYLNAIS